MDSGGEKGSSSEGNQSDVPAERLGGYSPADGFGFGQCG